MNRLIRGILYITAGCVGIGIATLVLGLALGGGNLDFEDDDMYHQALSAVDTVREITADTKSKSTSDASVDRGTAYDEAEYLEDEDGYYLLTVDAYEVSTLQIDIKHGELDIVESSDQKLKVFADEPVDGILAECSDGRLKIEDHRQGSKSREDVYISLHIPTSMLFEDVDLKVDAGIIQTECIMRTNTLVLKADAGEITLDGINAEKLTASVGAGMIDIVNGDFGSLEMDCGVGEMDFEGSIQHDSKISCGMGAVDVMVYNGAENYNYVLDCGMGSIEIGDNSYSGVTKARRIDNGAEATLTLDCGMGEICID